MGINDDFDHDRCLQNPRSWIEGLHRIITKKKWNWEETEDTND